jgi:hypothetical protein
MTKQIAENLKALSKAHMKRKHNISFSKCFNFNKAISLLYPALTHDEKQDIYNHIISQ